MNRRGFIGTLLGALAAARLSTFRAPVAAIPPASPLSIKTHLFVGPQGDFKTVAEALRHVPRGGMIIVMAGHSEEITGPLDVSTPGVSIVGLGKACA